MSAEEQVSASPVDWPAAIGLIQSRLGDMHEHRCALICSLGTSAYRDAVCDCDYGTMRAALAVLPGVVADAARWRTVRDRAALFVGEAVELTESDDHAITRAVDALRAQPIDAAPAPQGETHG